MSETTIAAPDGLRGLGRWLALSAAMIAYNNSFYLVAPTAIVVLPLAAFVRLKKR